MEDDTAVDAVEPVRDDDDGVVVPAPQSLVAGPGQCTHARPLPGAALRQRRVTDAGLEAAVAPAPLPREPAPMMWRDRVTEYCRVRPTLHWVYVLAREHDGATPARNTRALARASRCTLVLVATLFVAWVAAFFLRQTLLYRVTEEYAHVRDALRPAEELWASASEAATRDTTDAAASLADAVARAPSVLERWLPTHWVARTGAAAAVDTATAAAAAAYRQPVFADWAAFHAHAGARGCVPFDAEDTEARGRVLEQLRAHFAAGTRPTPATAHRFVTGPLLPTATTTVDGGPFVCACTVDVRGDDDVAGERETLTWLNPRVVDAGRGCGSPRECATDYYTASVERPPVLRRWHGTDTSAGATGATVDERLPYSVTIGGTLVRRDPQHATAEWYPYTLHADAERTFRDVQDMVSLKYCLRFLPAAAPETRA